jgi:hypothetical protein
MKHIKNFGNISAKWSDFSWIFFAANKTHPGGMSDISPGSRSAPGVLRQTNIFFDPGGIAERKLCTRHVCVFGKRQANTSSLGCGADLTLLEIIAPGRGRHVVVVSAMEGRNDMVWPDKRPNALRGQRTILRQKIRQSCAPALLDNLRVPAVGQLIKFHFASTSCLFNLVWTRFLKRTGR